jgi:transposase-like protein
MLNFQVRRILRYAINVLLLRPCGGDLPQPTQFSRDACSHPRAVVATECIPTEFSYFFESFLLLVIFSDVIMTGKRQRCGETAQPIRKRTKIDLEMKIKMIKKYEGGQSLSAIARELGLSASTVNTTVKDADRIKEHVKGAAPLKSTLITKQRSGAVYEMGKLLTTWMEDQIQWRVPLSLMTIQAKAGSLHADITGKRQDAPQNLCG